MQSLHINRSVSVQNKNGPLWFVLARFPDTPCTLISWFCLIWKQFVTVQSVFNEIIWIPSSQSWFSSSILAPTYHLFPPGLWAKPLFLSCAFDALYQPSLYYYPITLTSLFPFSFISKGSFNNFCLFIQVYFPSFLKSFSFITKLP